ncbi:MAG TPA: Crp/Fnr family transcriptional regulator [Magnetospirillum sp.]|jgi:CRP-like cAMP-binding protein|nr:Crp/Fnr family transcriptional regulator [Magnetospirillum sp.]
MPTADNWTSMVARERLSVRKLAAGEAAFRQGDRAAAVYVVQSGRIRLLRHLEDGSSVSVYVARPGDSFAEASLWAESYHCDGLADVPSVITAIPKSDLLRVLEDNPQATMVLARILAAQVRISRSSLELRNIRSARERLLAWLRLQANGAPPTVALDRPWTQIAAELGLTHEVIYRTLAALQAEGLITRTAREIVLLAHV